MSVAASFEVIDGLCEMPGKLLFAPILYNEYAFIELKDYHSLKTFLALDQSGQILARIRFAKTGRDTDWTSLPGAPFGGLESASEFDVSDFLAYIQSQFQGSERLELRTGAGIYENNHQAIINAGFAISGEEINHHVDLTSDISLHAMERRRLRKAEVAGCVFKRWPLDSGGAAKLHSFISKCRRAQDLEINITEEDFKLATDTLPSEYEAYVVELGDEIIAATVVVRVTGDIAYNYLPASDKAYNHLSPMVMLMTRLYHELSDQGFKTLDWGVTSIEGKEQKSLARFKEAMGAVSNRKTIYLSSLAI
ncbi:MAG: GNAT family N-acetyltransferase [Cyclobacteriaceae bacterium]